MKFLVFLVLVGVGLLFVLKTDGLVGVTGRVGWAERNLGNGGTFSLYKLIGLLLIVIGMLYVTGLFDRMFRGILTFIFGGFGQTQ